MTADPSQATVRLEPVTNAELARMSDAELRHDMVRTARIKDALSGRESQLSAEMARRQAFRAEGATSIEAWISAQCRRSAANARVTAHVGERLFDLPHLQAAISSGKASFDQVRSVVDVADPESDAQWASETIMGRSVRELNELARRASAEANGAPPAGRPERPSLRFNDSSCTMTARLPKEAFAEVRGRLEGVAKELGNDGTKPYDQRLGEALVALARGTSRNSSGASRKAPGDADDRDQPVSWDLPPFVVVAHVALSTLLDPSNTLGAELERDGLISSEVVRRLACDAKRVVALNDEAGHTMYEGRARRFPTETQRRELLRRDRHCRFPGCSHVRFLNAHHVTPWKPGGNTDLDNLVILCEHHHHLVHSKGWSMSGDANDELRFVGEDGGVSTSHPSPLWGRIGAARAPDVAARSC
jgi:hypothetical protein